MSNFTKYHLKLMVKGVDLIEQGLNILKDNLLILYGYEDNSFENNSNNQEPHLIEQQEVDNEKNTR